LEVEVRIKLADDTFQPHSILVSDEYMGLLDLSVLQAMKLRDKLSEALAIVKKNPIPAVRPEAKETAAEEAASAATKL
jgi:hypothetical protein